MEFTSSVNEWLPWLGRVRFLIITFFVTVVVAVRQLTPIPLPIRTVVTLVAVWYTLAIVYVIVRRLLPHARWQAPLQMVLDLVIIPGGVYSTGAQQRFFSRGRQFRTAGMHRLVDLLRHHPAHFQLYARSAGARVLASQ